VAAVRQLLGTARLVTLTGAGGSGKTRLAEHVVAEAGADFPDGVAWVELAPLQDAELLPGYILGALGAEQGARTALAALVETVQGRRMLLALDNCEHLVGACAALVEALLRSNADLRVLATSREALGVAGERAWLVPGLALPPAGESPAVEAVAGSEAVRLFVDRAQAALATFRLTPANAAAVARICRRLDGLPLAIELAAARSRSLTPDQLASRLDESFRILTSGSRTAIPRHRTLHEAIDWSYRLLDTRERQLLQRLSTFAGDFALEQAEAVAADADLDPADLLDTLGALVDKSLVAMREDGGIARYTLLETIRQFAHERLEEAGQQPLFCHRHAMTYATMVAEAAPHFITQDRPQHVARVLRELDNVRLALACTRNHHHSEHLALSASLAWFWYSAGLWSEGRRWLEGALALPEEGPPGADRAATLLGAGVLAALQGQTEIALPWLNESTDIAARLGDRSGEAYALAYIAVAHGQKGDEAAREPAERALAFFREAGDLYGTRLVLVTLSMYHTIRGDLERAHQMGEEAVEVAREFGLPRELAIALQILGSAALAAGDLARANGLFRESLACLMQDRLLFWIARALDFFGQVTGRLGQPLRGLRLLGAADACRATIGAGLLAHDRDRLAPVLAAAKAELGEAAYAQAWAEGQAAPLDEVLDEAVRQSEATAEAVGAGPAAAAPASVAPAEAGVSDAAAPVLEVQALGPLRVLRDGRPLPPESWRYARPRELLLYLLAHPEGRTRDQIGLVFWPDASAMQVKNNFHVSLHHMRRALGRGDLIVYDGDRYRVAWELGVRYDARTFEEALAPFVATGRRLARTAPANQPPGPDPAPEAEAALELYRGDFLAEEGAGDWHLETRDRLRRLFAAALLQLAGHRERAGAHAEAADLYRRVVALEELQEDAHRRLMASLARAGDRAGAIRQYERLAALLRSELEAEPEPETRALYEKLRRADPI